MLGDVLADCGVLEARISGIGTGDKHDVYTYGHHTTHARAMFISDYVC